MNTVYLFSFVVDSMFRLKYMQLRKEMELGKKRLQQEHEEEKEKLLSNRKSVEKKVNTPIVLMGLNENA